MKRKLQVLINEDAWNTIDALQKDANREFKCGNINYSDIVNEIIVTSKLDIKLLQAKCTNIRKSLRNMASEKEIDLDKAIKYLTDLKSKSGKRVGKCSPTQEELL